MIQDETIEYLDKLETGMFLTVNIPIFGDEVKPVTVMYIGIMLEINNYFEIKNI